jgi:hypothetical protein
MAGYLDQYGAGEERRNRIIIRSILALLIAGVLGTLTWYLTLNHREEGVVKTFIAALKRGDTQGAYRIWGCSDPKACSGYDYERFLKDWGPGAADPPDLATMVLTDSEECNSAVMLTLQVNAKRIEQLWVDKGANTINFAPFPICPMQIPYEIMVHRTVGKLRKILLK